MAKVQVELIADLEVRRFLVLDIPDGTDIDDLPWQEITELVGQDLLLWGFLTDGTPMTT